MHYLYSATLIISGAGALGKLYFVSLIIGEHRKGALGAFLPPFIKYCYFCRPGVLTLITYPPLHGSDYLPSTAVSLFFFNELRVFG